MDKTGIIILAAGNSSRLGQPKQLLEYQGKTLLQRSVDEALSLNAAEVVVILGSNHAMISEETILNGTTVLVNHRWQTGMASSIQAGIGHFHANNKIESALLMLCDQPHVDQVLLKELVKKQQNSDCTIVASSYGNTLGVPAVFSREMFPALLSLQGQEGARKLIASNKETLKSVPFQKGYVDIDTSSDYSDLINGIDRNAT